MSDPEFDLSKASGMYEFCQYYGMGSNVSKSWALKHFSLIQDALWPGEEVLSVFMGIHNYISATKHENNAAYAITTERIIVAQKNFIGKAITSVSLSYVNDMKIKTGLLGGTITFDAMSETFSVFFNKEIAQRVYEHAQQCISYAKAKKEERIQESGTNNLSSLRDLKSLLDDGIISKEEFEVKKRQILGI